MLLAARAPAEVKNSGRRTGQPGAEERRFAEEENRGWMTCIFMPALRECVLSILEGFIPSACGKVVGISTVLRVLGGSMWGHRRTVKTNPVGTGGDCSSVSPQKNSQKQSPLEL